jgi:hypothetical protein
VCDQLFDLGLFCFRIAEALLDVGFRLHIPVPGYELIRVESDNSQS